MKGCSERSWPGSGRPAPDFVIRAPAHQLEPMARFPTDVYAPPLGFAAFHGLIGSQMPIVPGRCDLCQSRSKVAPNRPQFGHAQANLGPNLPHLRSRSTRPRSHPGQQVTRLRQRFASIRPNLGRVRPGLARFELRSAAATSTILARCWRAPPNLADFHRLWPELGQSGATSAVDSPTIGGTWAALGGTWHAFDRLRPSLGSNAC